MSKNQIVEKIVESGIVVKVAKRYHSYISGGLDDFIQHIYLTICEIPDEKLIALYNKEQLPYYVFYICKAQATNPNGKFHTEHDGKFDTVPLKNEMIESGKDS